jgi:hypothetical protein
MSPAIQELEDKKDINLNASQLTGMVSAIDEQ